jgi:hypothetical protein
MLQICNVEYHVSVELRARAFTIAVASHSSQTQPGHNSVYGMSYVHGAQKEICVQHTTLRNLAKQNKVGSISTTTRFFKRKKERHNPEAF